MNQMGRDFWPTLYIFCYKFVFALLKAKLWNSNHRPSHVLPDLEASLRDLGLTYVDSFVIHWPMAVPSTGKRCALRPDGCRPGNHRENTMFPLDDEGYYCGEICTG